MVTYTVKTFGCQMNVHDSERIHEVLRREGYCPTEDCTEADIIVVNTCSVREKAEQKLRSLVGTFADLKTRRPDLLIAVAGCMAQEHGKALFSRLRAVDIVVGPDNIAELPGLVRRSHASGKPVAHTVFDLDSPVFLPAEPKLLYGTERPATAFVTVMKGCDERCSFCIVPFTRGTERYRPSDAIVAEVAAQVEAGVREVTLLGQTVNSYRDPMGALPRAPEADAANPDESEFAALLRAIATNVPGLARLRYASPHPRHMTPSLLAAHRDLGVLAKHVHLPVQSGSDAILKRMIRRYTRADYLERVRLLREARPGLTFSTDIIVGFPGESEADFAETLSLVQEVGFTSLFGFMYSPRPQTPARKLSLPIPEDVKAARLAALFALSERLGQAHLASLVGRTETVLVEGPSKAGGADSFTGRTERNEIVHFAVPPAASSWVGQLVSVRITFSHKHSLEGELLAVAETEERDALRRRRLPVL